MVSANCASLVDEFLALMGREFEVLPQDGQRCVLLTPFRRPDGELIEIEASTLPDGRIRLSDMGQSVAFLYVNGLTISRGVLDNARRLCRSHGIDLMRSELFVEAMPSEDGGESLHELIQATLHVSDLIQSRRPSTNFLFRDIVESFLVTSRVIYDPDFPVRGRDSIHEVAFHVNSGRKIIVQPLTANQENVALAWAERWAYRLEDIHANDPAWSPYMILDDRGERAGVWTERARRPLEHHANVVLWRENETLANALEEANP